MEEQRGAAEERPTAELVGWEAELRDSQHLRVGDRLHQQLELRRLCAAIEVLRVVQVAHRSGAVGLRCARLTGLRAAVLPLPQAALAQVQQPGHALGVEQRADDQVLRVSARPTQGRVRQNEK